jgi:hypothetical protein
MYRAQGRNQLGLFP